MKPGNYIYLLLFILIAVNSNYSQTDKPNSEEKVFSVLVMPFQYNQHYPYYMDQIRESLINGFRTKGFNVVTNDTLWSLILEEEDDYDLSNISMEKAEEIASYTGTDLVVFGNIFPIARTESVGLPSSTQYYKPLLIKVYDSSQKSLVIFERANIYEHWGLNAKVNSIYEIAVDIARDLVTMGY